MENTGHRLKTCVIRLRRMCGARDGLWYIGTMRHRITSIMIFDSDGKLYEEAHGNRRDLVAYK
jgi:hypothetical protein